MKKLKVLVPLLVLLTGIVACCGKIGEKTGEEKSAEGPKDMVLIPAGEFLMGSPPGEGENDEHAAHRVYVDAFYIDKYDVTNRQFEQFVEATKYVTEAEKQGWGQVWTGKDWGHVSGADWRHPHGAGSVIDQIMDHPVVQVSWNDAVAYAQWAGKRLPTEAEWEKAARGTDERKYPWGNTQPNGHLCNFADSNTDFIWSDKSSDDGYQYTSPVGKYEDGKNAFGLYDMAGNVWQWCSDWYKEDYYSDSPTRNPKGPTSGDFHVFRGGSWSDKPDNLRAANRNGDEPTFRSDNLGFRCVQNAK